MTFLIEIFIFFKNVTLQDHLKLASESKNFIPQPIKKYKNAYLINNCLHNPLLTFLTFS